MTRAKLARVSAWRAAATTVTLAVVGAGLAACSDEGSMEAFCATAREFAVDNPAAVFDRYDPGDPASAVALLRAAGDQLRDWADEAPGEIGDDVDRIAEATDELAVSFEQPDAADTAGGSAERTAELAASFAEVEAASVRVTAYTRENCEVDLDPATPPVTPAAEPTTAPTAAP